MPELPEVQTIVDQLKDGLKGKTIEAIDVNLPKMFIGHRKDVVDKKIVDVRRRAKMIILELSGELNLVIHLKMTGQLVYTDQKDIVTLPNPVPFNGSTLPGKTTHVVIHLNKGTLFFNDMRQFGWVKVVNTKQLQELDAKHGPDALGKDFTTDYLAKICANWGRPIKLLLLEQSKIAGIGNIYANEALWCAEIDPTKKGKQLDQNQIKNLHHCIQEVLEKGLKYGGSSATDEAFINAKGEKGHMQEHFKVYQKQKTPCPRCGATIVMSRIGGRGTFSCPKCQK